MIARILRTIFKNKLFKSIVIFAFVFYGINAKNNPSYYLKTNGSKEVPQADTSKKDETVVGKDLHYPFKDQSLEDPLTAPKGGLRLNDPSNIKIQVDYDPKTKQYNVSQKLGRTNYRPPSYLDNEEYNDYQFKKSVKDYWKQKEHKETAKDKKPLVPKLKVGGEAFDRIFGSNTVEIKPQGSVELIFGANTSKTQNPAIPVRNRKITTFEFNEKIQLNVTGKIGEKLKLATNYNTEATFDFENQMKLNFNGQEDDIIKKIDAGNVTLPLTGSLITGSQSLFGIKTQLQFGRLTATSVLSQEKGKKSEIEIKGGAQTTKFEVKGDNYEVSKHYFLSQFFRDQYEKALANLPVINSSLNIAKIEVWITNKNRSIESTRNIVALADLGETGNHITNTNAVTGNVGELPTDASNNVLDLMKGFLPTRDINAVSTSIGLDFIPKTDFEKLENARKLAPTEYTLNTRLGFISLNQSLNYDEILAVAYQYTYNGKVYQVGEFSTDGVAPPKLLFVKMLKNSQLDPNKPIWDLMMKNVYSLGAYQVNAQDFRLDIMYNNAATGVDINYIPGGPINGKPLIQVLNLDRINSQGAAPSDGFFDFIEGVTITASNGRIFFPVLEPFGSYLESKFNGDGVSSKYVYKQLYDSTRTIALQFPEKNRFKLKGTYQSNAGSEISLNAINIPQGSVIVTAGGIRLIENTDYTVDYNLGRVKILNEGVLNSGTPVKISLESNTLFQVQTKSLIGTQLDYKVSKDISLGATILHLSERPITQKVSFGDEPISNTIWGLQGNYRTEAPFLTTLVDKIPLISTKEKSSISTSGEFAQLIPGHSKAIGKNGNAYIDDFEGSQSPIDLKSIFAWSLASTPQGQTRAGMFPEGNLKDDLAYGFNRAKLAWYNLDPIFLTPTNGVTPSHLTKDEMSNNLIRQVLETEIFPNKQVASGTPINTTVLDLAFFPSERGPYNYDVGKSGFSSGINADGTLINPSSRWAGIMRKIDNSDFEANNIQFIHFWMMDPFNKDYIAEFGAPPSSGELYFNLGTISEDVLKDGRKSYESGLPTSSSANTVPVVKTKWGRVPDVQSVITAFDGDPNNRVYQDVGLDGYGDGEERVFFDSAYIQKLALLHGTSSLAYQSATSDPSADNYHYFRGDDYDNEKTSILNRYKKYNGLEGNTPTQEQYSKINAAQYSTVGNPNTPNIEDINSDLTLEESESYYQYKINLTPGSFVVGENFITNKIKAQSNLKNGKAADVDWYEFKVPIKEYETKVGSLEGFRAIRFMRMFFKNCEKPVVCRFARLELLRNDWRKYDYPLPESNYGLITEDNSTFNLGAVNIEENGTKTPVNYVLPPGIERQVNPSTVNLVRLNEQSMAINTCGLQDGDAKAVYKNADIDFRSYKKLQLFSHAEAKVDGGPLKSGDLTLFMRLGTDYTDNYYEYEVPLQVTPAGSYSSTSAHVVWPDANNMIVDFELLKQAKIKLSDPALQGSFVKDGNNKIRVKGHPTLSSVKVIMIGIRNPRQTSSSTDDDGLSKCVEVWVNELRLTDFDEKGGWAAIGRSTFKLADFATVALAGNISTPGFGSIEKKLNDRQRETIFGFDASSNVELGKFLPKESNIKIPAYFGYSKQVSTPRFNPLDPDILMQTALDNLGTQRERDSLKYNAQDFTQRKSINFTNVKKEKGKKSKKSNIYDIENFSVSYAYTEVNKHNMNTQFNNLETHKGIITYGYNANPKNYQPFSKIKFLNKKYLAIIKDFNFYLLPKSIGFNTDINRSFNEVKTRQTLLGSDAVDIPVYYNKSFTWNRNYDLKYDLTKALKFDFNASNNAKIIEPNGSGRLSEEQKDSLKRDLFKNFGTNIHYRHAANLNYTFPFSKIPILDFVSASGRYGSTYEWTRAPIGADSIGGTIQNSNSKQLNGNLTFTTLYNKVPYLKKINQKPLGLTPPNKDKDKIAEAKKKLKTRIRVLKLLNDTLTLKKIQDSVKAEKKKEKPKEFLVAQYFFRTLMSVKNASLTFTESQGTSLSGYNGNMKLLGMDSAFKGPSPGFLFGQQSNFGRSEDHFGRYAEKNKWLATNNFSNPPYTRTTTNNYSFRASVEPPIPSLKIEISANRNETKNYNEIFKFSDSTNKFESQTPIESGNFSMSYLTINTAFKKDRKDHTSEVFESFRNNREIVSALRANDPNRTSTIKTDSGYAGYGYTSQEVLIPAFLAAYSGNAPNKNTLTTFPIIPLPNWRVTYDGLTKIGLVKKYFKSFTLSHAYRSTYNIASYSNNLNYDIENLNKTDLAGNFLSQKLITSVSISEQFSPLIKADMTLLNNVLANFELKRDRNVTLGLSNLQVTEVIGREIVVGSGYRIKDVLFPFKVGKKRPKSDVNVKADISIRSNQTAIRKIVENVSQVTAGQTVISLKTSADYVLSDKVNLRFFFDKVVNKPIVSTSFRTSNANVGLSLRMTLAP